MQPKEVLIYVASKPKRHHIIYVGGFHDYGITMFIKIMVKMEIMTIIMLMVKMVVTDDDVYHLGDDLPGHLA